MTTPRRESRRCQDVTKDGLPCPTPARKRPDPDGVYRCIQHSVEPQVAAAIRVARHKGGFKNMEIVHAGPPVVSGERYETAAQCDQVIDEAINVLRLELRVRKTPKAQVAGAIATMIEAKLKLRTLAYVAGATRRLHPVTSPRESPA